ncbi:ABC transporter permease [Arenibaculum sp.]|jgi:NitT/TauT family transport system permease protein|uniref:ABC transporter permease n=1 Tax=Arenibaculum sp. TaxID=2865862 RepID=UPI002E0D65F1|nr:ABC transporter permease [Arenibaculum sp.]
MRTILRRLDAVLGFVFLALAWEICVRVFEIKPYLLPAITDVLRSFWQHRAELAYHSLITTTQVALGFAAAVVGGVAISLAVFFFDPVRRVVMPIIVALQGIPKIALAPLFVVWFGYGTTSKVLMAFLFAFFPVVIASLGGLAGTPAHLIEHFRAIGASRAVTFWRLRVPSALPSFVDGCKMAMPLAVIGAIVGEFVGSDSGLGNLILMANAAARTDLLFAAILAITAISGLLYAVIHLFGTKVWWRAL